VGKYQIEISFGGGNIRLEIKDSAKWILGSLTVFTSAPGNAVTFNITIQQPYVHLESQDFKTHVNAFLKLSIETSLDNITLDVLNDGTVLVKSPVDSFADQTPGQRTHILKLK
jgi:hypothetical protein